MTSKYEPITGQVRHAYWSHVSYERMIGNEPPGEPLEEFDLWLDRVKAEALREAVSDFESSVGSAELHEESKRPDSPKGWGFAECGIAWEHQGVYMDWLSNRADRIEKGESNV